IVVWRPQGQSRYPRSGLEPRPEGVDHRLSLAKQIGNTTEVLAFQRAALGPEPESLHDEVQDVRVPELEEMKDGGVLVAPVLQVGVGFGVRCDERWRGDAKHVLSKFLILHQLASGHPHDFEADAHEADIINVRGYIRAWSGKADPGLKRLRLGEDAATHVLGNIVADDNFTTHDAVRFSVAAALVV